MVPEPLWACRRRSSGPPNGAGARRVLLRRSAQTVRFGLPQLVPSSLPLSSVKFDQFKQQCYEWLTLLPCVNVRIRGNFHAVLVAPTIAPCKRPIMCGLGNYT
jgi:hypothetical protein